MWSLLNFNLTKAIWHPDCENTWEDAKSFSEVLRRDFDRDNKDYTDSPAESLLPNVNGLGKMTAASFGNLCKGLLGVYVEHSFLVKDFEDRKHSVCGQITGHVLPKRSAARAGEDQTHILRIQWDDNTIEDASVQRIFFYLGLGPVSFHI